RVEVVADQHAERDRSAVRSEPDAFAVPCGKADAVEDLVRGIDVVLGVLRGELLVEERRDAARRLLPRLTLALVYDVDDFAAVDRVRQSNAEVAVVEE